MNAENEWYNSYVKFWNSNGVPTHHSIQLPDTRQIRLTTALFQICGCSLHWMMFKGGFPTTPGLSVKQTSTTEATAKNVGKSSR